MNPHFHTALDQPGDSPPTWVGPDPRGNAMLKGQLKLEDGGMVRYVRREDDKIVFTVDLAIAHLSMKESLQIARRMVELYNMAIEITDERPDQAAKD